MIKTRIKIAATAIGRRVILSPINWNGDLMLCLCSSIHLRRMKINDLLRKRQQTWCRAVGPGGAGAGYGLQENGRTAYRKYFSLKPPVQVTRALGPICVLETAAASEGDPPFPRHSLPLHRQAR